MPRGGARPGAGRPRGSKTKSKPCTVAAARPVGQVAPDKPPKSSDAAGATDTASLLEQYRRNAAALEAARTAATDPKEIASISTTLNRTYWHIGQLTGEAQITEAKIIRSEAWQRILMHMQGVLSRHPDAAAELGAYFESLEAT